MIVNKQNKGFQTRSDKPNSNWLNDDNYIVIPDNSELANKIMQLYPRYDFVLDENDNLIDVVAIQKTEEEIKQERIEEIKAELNSLDSTINRATEDTIEELHNQFGYVPYETTVDVINHKEDLREELKRLKGAGVNEV